MGGDLVEERGLERSHAWAGSFHPLLQRPLVDVCGVALRPRLMPVALCRPWTRSFVALCGPDVGQELLDLGSQNG